MFHGLDQLLGDGKIRKLLSKHICGTATDREKEEILRLMCAAHFQAPVAQRTANEDMLANLLGGILRRSEDDRTSQEMEIIENYIKLLDLSAVQIQNEKMTHVWIAELIDEGGKVYLIGYSATRSGAISLCDRYASEFGHLIRWHEELAGRTDDGKEIIISCDELEKVTLGVYVGIAQSTLIKAESDDRI